MKKPTYYIVCWAGGPVSVRLSADSEMAAVKEFDDATAETRRAWIDDPRLDIEDDLDIEAGPLSEYNERGFDAQLRAAGAIEIRSLSSSYNGHNMRGHHASGDWTLWRV